MNFAFKKLFKPSILRRIARQRNITRLIPDDIKTFNNKLKKPWGK